MTYLLDTNFVSEWSKPICDPGVIAWLNDADENRLFISVITLAEIRRGIELLTPGIQQDRLDLWLRQDVLPRFESRVLPVDNAVADEWGRVMALSRAAGRSLQTLDAFIAATAKFHDLKLVTRNTKDFVFLDLPVINPWRNSASP